MVAASRSRQREGRIPMTSAAPLRAGWRSAAAEREPHPHRSAGGGLPQAFPRRPRSRWWKACRPTRWNRLALGRIDRAVRFTTPRRRQPSIWRRCSTRVSCTRLRAQERRRRQAHDAGLWPSATSSSRSRSHAIRMPLETASPWRRPEAAWGWKSRACRRCWTWSNAANLLHAVLAAKRAGRPRVAFTARLIMVVMRPAAGGAPVAGDPFRPRARCWNRGRAPVQMLRERLVQAVSPLR